MLKPVPLGFLLSTYAFTNLVRVNTSVRAESSNFRTGGQEGQYFRKFPTNFPTIDCKTKKAIVLTTIAYCLIYYLNHAKFPRKWQFVVLGGGGGRSASVG